MTNLFRRIFGASNKTAKQVVDQSADALDFNIEALGNSFEIGEKDTYRFIAIDVETANGNKHSICQIGLAMVTDSGAIRTASFLVDPDEWFEDFNVELHGIDEEAVEGAPNFGTLIQTLRPILERHTLIQHSSFDRLAIDAACGLSGTTKLRTNWLDSVIIARTAWPELKGKGGHGLANLKNYLGLEFDHHDAEEDARAAAEVVLRAESHTGEKFPNLARTARQKSQNYPISVAVVGNQNGPLFGHVACFTGQLSLSRTEAATIAAGAGITIKTGVSKMVTLVIVGDQDLNVLAGHTKSAKHRRAEELVSEGSNISIIGEREFLELVGRETPHEDSS